VETDFPSPCLLLPLQTLKLLMRLFNIFFESVAKGFPAITLRLALERKRGAGGKENKGQEKEQEQEQEQGPDTLYRPGWKSNVISRR